MNPVLKVAVATAFRDAGADSAEAGVLEEGARGLHIFLENLLKHAVKFSEGSHRTEPNARDVAAALECVGLSVAALSPVNAGGQPLIDCDRESPEPPVAEFRSPFAAPGPPLPHAPPPRFPKLPAAHLCMSTPQKKEPLDDYNAVEQERGKERMEMIEALINLQLRQTGGGIEVAGYPELRVLAHTRSPPYLSVSSSREDIVASEVATWPTYPDVGGSLATPLADSLFDVTPR